MREGERERKKERERERERNQNTAKLSSASEKRSKWTSFETMREVRVFK